MDRGRVGEDRGSKETDGCPLTVFAVVITVAAVFNAAAAFTVSTATIIVTAAVSIAFTVFTATAAISVSSISASDRLLPSVNSVRPWSYHPLALFPQSVMNI
jgi:hypothetical protein